MRLSRTQFPAKPGRKARKKDPEALNNVVSLRISDQEKRVLQRLTEATCKNVSELVREALDLWLSKNKRLAAGGGVRF